MGDMEPIISMITTGLKVQQEGQVMRAVQEAGVYVDKERLIKALEDARTYWEEGYRAALADRPHGRWVDNHCTNCGMTPLGEELWEHLDVEPPRFELCFPICPCCGAKMDLEE